MAFVSVLTAVGMSNEVANNFSTVDGDVSIVYWRANRHRGNERGEETCINYAIKVK